MNPVLVEVTRGQHTESIHRGAFVVVDSLDRVVLEVGDTLRHIYPRSAVKPLQAIALVESGAADQLGLSDGEIALACGSHTGEPFHVDAAKSMLLKAGLDASCLECGSHWPLGEAAGRALAASGESPTALHNNCSGKHAGFICLACFRGHDVTGYTRADHPTMREVTAILTEFTGAVLDEENMGIDGCTIPTYAIPLRACALGFARLATGEGLSPVRKAAAARIRAAMANHPEMVTGPGQFESRLMAVASGRVVCKGGAEGVFCAALPDAGLGVAIKIDDGAGRAAEIVMAAVLQLIHGSLPAAHGSEIGGLATRAILNRANAVVGQIRPSATVFSHFS